MRGAAAALLLASLAGAARAQPSAPPCFWIHGRLFAANGAPTLRIWRIGTKRIFGVVGGPGDHDNPALPPALAALIAPDAFQVVVYGDYRVCPLHKDHPGWMRFVHLDQAHRLAPRPRAIEKPAD
jgi:hypothetical protein